MCDYSAMLKLIQLVTGLGVGALLIWQRETERAAGQPTSLDNPYVIGVLALFAAFAITALPIGLYRDIPRWYGLWKSKKALRAQQRLHERVTRDRRTRIGK